jgi:pyruvate dehydrogenase E2 component (dihydrolipoamide acetyltransferase)
MTEITMPRLSDSMEEGTILTWLKADGDRLAAGDELVEVETDKATVTVSAEVDGRLSIVAPAGSTVAPGDLIARVADAGEELGVAPEIADEDDDAPAPPPVVATKGSPGAAAADRSPAGVAGPPGGGAEVIATPLARRVARVHGVELAQLPGTGPRGRITRSDVLAAAGVQAPAPPRRPEPPAPAAAPPTAPPAGRGAAAAQPLTRLQQLIARRMSDSRAAIPEFEVQTEVAMDAALEFRERLRAGIGPEDTLPSLNDLIVRACALALRRHPRLNASWSDGGIIVHERINIGVAVATDDALIVPTVFDADTRSLGTIAREARRLAEGVRSGQIAPAELEGGTFTVSNLGMFGMTAIRPVINPPQAAILGVGATRDTLARVDGVIVDRRLMTLTLSADHRIVYGADAARFLSEVRRLLQAPLLIVL